MIKSLLKWLEKSGYNPEKSNFLEMVKRWRYQRHTKDKRQRRNNSQSWQKSGVTCQDTMPG